jgi:hypothetical protein
MWHSADLAGAGNLDSGLDLDWDLHRGKLVESSRTKEGN